MEEQINMRRGGREEKYREIKEREEERVKRKKEWINEDSG